MKPKTDVKDRRILEVKGAVVGEIRPSRFSYKTLAGYGLDAASTKSVTLDKGKMSAAGVFATDAKDRMGDILEIKGISTVWHECNPISMWNHGRELSIPIAKCVDPDGNYTVTLMPDLGEATCVTYFSQHLLESEQIYQLIDERIISAMSIGYRPLKAMRLPIDPSSLQKPGLHLQAVDLLEVSWVAYPANQECVRAALSRDQICGKSLSKAIRRSLMPLMGTPKVWSPGANLKSKVIQMADPVVEQRATEANESVAPDQPVEGAKAGEEGEPFHAEVLRNIHQALLSAHDYCSTVSPRLDNQKCMKMVDDVTSGINKHLNKIEDSFAEMYPDLDPPEGGVKDMPEEEEGGDQGGGDEAEGKAPAALAAKTASPEEKDGDDDGLSPEEKKLATKALAQLEREVAHKERLLRRGKL